MEKYPVDQSNFFTDQNDRTCYNRYHLSGQWFYTVGMEIMTPEKYYLVWVSSLFFQSVSSQTVSELSAHTAFCGYGKNSGLITTVWWHAKVVRCSNKNLVQGRRAYIIAKWHKLTVGYFWSIYRRERKWCLKNELSVTSIQINILNRILQQWPSYYYYSMEIFSQKKSPQR